MKGFINEILVISYVIQLPFLVPWKTSCDIYNMRDFFTRAEKKQIAEIIRQAKGDGKAHTAQQTIPYIQMYPDGICKVTGRKYSKTVAFDDDRNFEEDFTEVYNTYKRLVYHTAYKIMDDSYLAEDVLQEVFLYVAKNFSKIHRENCHELAAYLVSCSRSRAYDMLHLSSWMTTLPMMLIGMTGILLVIGFLVLVVMALNCLAHRK